MINSSREMFLHLSKEWPDLIYNAQWLLIQYKKKYTLSIPAHQTQQSDHWSNTSKYDTEVTTLEACFPHADKGNQTDELLITRCWLYSWAITTQYQYMSPMYCPLCSVTYSWGKMTIYWHVLYDIWYMWTPVMNLNVFVMCYIIFFITCEYMSVP